MRLLTFASYDTSSVPVKNYRQHCQPPATNNSDVMAQQDQQNLFKKFNNSKNTIITN